MSNNARRSKLLVLFRAGVFAIAIAFSAIALISFFSVARRSRDVRNSLEIAERRGRELTLENNKLRDATKLRDSLQSAASSVENFVANFYQLCREPSDLPQLKTDFIVTSDWASDHMSQGIAFSVPHGSHMLKLTIQRVVDNFEDGEPTILKFPLLPSAGYFVRLHSASGSESKTSPIDFELLSNSSSFKPIRQSLPASLGGAVGIATNRLFGHLAYPNETSLADAYLVRDAIGAVQGVRVASVRLDSQEYFTRLHLDVVSDSHLSVRGVTASMYSNARDRLDPYTGNGRFHVP